MIECKLASGDSTTGKLLKISSVSSSDYLKTLLEDIPGASE